MYYSLRKYKKKCSYDILTDISENVTLVQLIDYLSNVNRAINVVGYWIFESNYKRALVLNRESLNMICALFVGEVNFAVFGTVCTAVKNICLYARLKKD